MSIGSQCLALDVGPSDHVADGCGNPPPRGTGRAIGSQFGQARRSDETQAQDQSGADQLKQWERRRATKTEHAKYANRFVSQVWVELITRRRGSLNTGGAQYYKMHPCVVQHSGVLKSSTLRRASNVGTAR
jgi:hypothetical protein